MLAESDDLNLTSPLWAIGGGDVYVNEQLVATNITGLLWSNFPYILAPQPAFERSYQAAAGSGDVLDPDSWLMELPCNSTPRIEFNWGGRNWSLSESNSYLDSGMLTFGAQRSNEIDVALSTPMQRRAAAIAIAILPYSGAIWAQVSLITFGTSEKGTMLRIVDHTTFPTDRRGSFMANFYTVFNYSETEGARIGFATLAESA